MNRLRFPSSDAPGADLRVMDDTRYVFVCQVCRASVGVLAATVLSAAPPRPVSSVRELRTALGLSDISIVAASSVEFVPAPCQACGTEYVLAYFLEETSNCAWRFQVVGLVQVEASEAERQPGDS